MCVSSLYHSQVDHVDLNEPHVWDVGRDGEGVSLGGVGGDAWLDVVGDIHERVSLHAASLVFELVHVKRDVLLVNLGPAEEEPLEGRVVGDIGNRRVVGAILHVECPI